MQVLVSITLGVKEIYYIDTDEIPGFFLLLKNNIFIARSEDIGVAMEFFSSSLEF